MCSEVDLVQNMLDYYGDVEADPYPRNPFYKRKVDYHGIGFLHPPKKHPLVSLTWYNGNIVHQLFLGIWNPEDLSTYLLTPLPNPVHPFTRSSQDLSP